MPGIINLPKFNYEDLEEIVAGGQGSFIQFAATSFYLQQLFNLQHVLCGPPYFLDQLFINIFCLE